MAELDEGVPGVGDGGEDAQTPFQTWILMPANIPQGCTKFDQDDLQTITSAEIAEIFNISEATAARVRYIILGENCSNTPVRMLPNADCLAAGSTVEVPLAGAAGSSFSLLKTGVMLMIAGDGEQEQKHLFAQDGTEGIFVRAANECGYPEKQDVVNGTTFVPVNETGESLVHFRKEGTAIRLQVKGDDVLAVPEGETPDPDIHTRIPGESYVLYDPATKTYKDAQGTTDSPEALDAEVLDAGGDQDAGVNDGTVAYTAQPPREPARNCQSVNGMGFVEMGAAALAIYHAVRGRLRRTLRS